MLYVLDTNTLSAMRFDPSLVSAADVATTSFNLSEILYGALRRPELADVQSFAVAVVHDATLVTRNVRHFPFEELNVVTRC